MMFEQRGRLCFAMYCHGHGGGVCFSFTGLLVRLTGRRYQVDRSTVYPSTVDG